MCPECREPLIAFELEGVEIDHCLTCRGTWLDAGEIEQICEISGSPAGGLSAALERSGSGERSKRRCPRCKRKMNRVSIGTDRPVEIERCRFGHGMWFDAGEIKTLLKSFAEGEEGRVAGFLSDMFRYELESASPGE